jgi:plastocyanin
VVAPKKRFGSVSRMRIELTAARVLIISYLLMSFVATLFSTSYGQTAANASVSSVEVKMLDMPATFQPAVVTIKVGETIVWKNVGTSVHDVSNDPAKVINPDDVSIPPGSKPFDSGYIQPGSTYTHTFSVTGKYKYACTPHESSGMTGEVVVE